jgi:hypothetical protein
MTESTRWRKGTRSAAQNACVELHVSQTGTMVRDSKNPDGGVLAIGVDTWSAFMGDIVRDDQSE